VPGSHASRRRTFAVLALLAASAFAVGLVVLRQRLTGEWRYENLVWNLFLAWIPFVFAVVAYDRDRRGRHLLAVLVPAAVWLAFLPNAPYLVTDYMLLREIAGVPVWFDVVMLTSFAWTGLVLGFVSVYLIQSIARRRAGAVAGWACSLAALGLCGIGIYLGRVLRWNSWDLAVQPTAVLGDVFERLQTPKLVGMSLVMATFLTLAYVTLYGVLRLAVDER
jgi:uncharacterized membrane protein